MTVIESSEAIGGQVTPTGVTYLASGQLGEVLMESADTGATIRQYEYTPFGERHEVLPAAEVATTVTFVPTGATSLSVVPVSLGLSAQLHFVDAAMVGCTLRARADSSWLGEFQVTAGGLTPWFPQMTRLVVELVRCPQAVNGDHVMGVRTAPAVARTTPHTEATTQPYPAAGQQFRLMLSEPSYVQLTNVAVASCDKIEARTPAGTVLWQWNPRGATIFGAYDTQAITPALQGAVDIGIWGVGCNATERQPGFAISAVIAEESSDMLAPVIVGLPGQKRRNDGSIDNWIRTYDPVLGRYLEPEGMLKFPAFLATMTARGMTAPAYSYAGNSPLALVDASGNATISLCDTTGLVVNALDKHIGKGGLTSVTFHPDVKCGADGELTIDIKLRCFTRLKFPRGDPRYSQFDSAARKAAGLPSVTYEEVLSHEVDHRSNANMFVTDWVARNQGAEGMYCSEKQCLEKKKELDEDFEALAAAFEEMEKH